MVGKSGEQLLIWDTTEFDATDVIRFDCVIGIRGSWKSNGVILNVLNVYGPHDDSKKQQLWDMLLKTVVNEEETWVVCGDFNEVRCESERFNCAFDGNRERRFNNFINSSGLIDINISGRLFTRISDDGAKFNFGPKPFKVFDTWFDDTEAFKIVEEAWNSTVYSGNRLDCKFAVKLKGVKAALKCWSKQKFGQINCEIELLKKEATDLELKAETAVLNESELCSWREKRKQWLEKEKKKASMCNIRGLFIDRVWNENPKDIKEEVFNHYKSIFDEPDSLRPSLEDLSYPSISASEVASLESPFSENEIFDVIKDCGSTKAPGPDGLNLQFYKLFWEITKGDLLSALNWFWENEDISRGCIASFLTLVPKKQVTLGLGDYRPISLIGSYYKIVAKILSNRLRKVLPNLIGPEQSVFLSGRYILDGILVANETVDFLKANRKQGIIFKVDFEKAFDSLNWCFLFVVMKSMGFENKWIKWIRACLKSASISILVNGSPTKEFSLGRGVRQGDPLSPFLFILAAEGLNILTKAATEKGLFRGVEIGNDKVLVSHLQFTDDTIFFGEWGRMNALNLRNLLKCFELSSGLKVNFQKSCLYGVGIEFDEVTRVANHIGYQAEKFPFVYLGLPIGNKMKKIEGLVSGFSLDDMQVAFSNSFIKQLGNGNNTSFWHEDWIRNDKLCILFPRLYRLESEIEATMQQRIQKNSDGFVCVWDWRRQPSGQTATEFVNLCDLISSASLFEDVKDNWSWAFSSNGLFTIKKLTSIIDEQSWGSTAQQPTLRNKLVPKKVEVFIWRVQNKRLPVKLELDKRGLDLHSVRCPNCDDDLESLEHAHVECKHVKEIWIRTLKWWDLSTTDTCPLI
ncbi:uncharacterized protein [Rutidosis leptorrhynchoides]|uniref:uncharacterized protein n=1 Tax=Rutidosis leptorrhynchoides TaxID=125765 RepID=UPI003A98FC26